jgi:hypothetical protein
MDVVPIKYDILIAIQRAINRYRLSIAKYLIKLDYCKDGIPIIIFDSLLYKKHTAIDHLVEHGYVDANDLLVAYEIASSTTREEVMMRESSDIASHIYKLYRKLTFH